MSTLQRFLSYTTLLSLLALLTQLHMLDTLVPLDPYWRYQGDMLATYILETGKLSSGTEFADHSLLTGWVNSFFDDFGSPLIVAVLALITGVNTVTLETMPLFAPALIIVQSTLAATVVGDKRVFPIALAAAVFYKFLAPHTFSNAHRGGLAWTILLFLILAVVLSKREGVRSTYLLVVFGIVLPTTAHTLPVAALLFLGIVFLLSETLGKQIFGLERAALVALVIIAYNLLVSTWIGRVVFKFAVATSSVSEPITPSTLVESLTRSAAVHESLIPYLMTGAPTEFKLLVIISVAIAGVVTLSVVAYRLRELFGTRSVKTVQTFDIIVVAFVIQAVVYVTIIPFFAPSGGINPPLLGLMFFPVILAKFYKISGDVSMISWSDTSRILFVLLILLPGAVASFANPMTVGEINSFSQDEYETLEWSSSFNNNRIVTDFGTASSYYAIGGRSPTYLPPPGEPAYGTEEAAQRVLQLYYDDPARACEQGDIYVVTERMRRTAILHLGSLVTRPTDGTARTSLEATSNMDLIFDSGDSFISACK
ncbi:SusD/RagB family nutrient-binding outer membrane lipoprotein [Halomicrobium salinisoli]|uniref:SusD/RagB family nutrient-binding outer membrane lipoprotein n=1 Tax=Halomicrobium salinisoli TaxID=2878391 RepID=UPI001CF07E50|nr:SusD/RagB family nutrient-binding outer membrane lipoprotein [Halomicrobium salinisoli]